MFSRKNALIFVSSWQRKKNIIKKMLAREHRKEEEGPTGWEGGIRDGERERKGEQIARKKRKIVRKMRGKEREIEGEIRGERERHNRKRLVTGVLFRERAMFEMFETQHRTVVGCLVGLYSKDPF